MNTVGKPGRLGDSIRCIVSVSMLSEGWYANTVTHVLGVRAFGTQLLCEQVVGRAAPARRSRRGARHRERSDAHARCARVGGGATRVKPLRDSCTQPSRVSAVRQGAD